MYGSKFGTSTRNNGNSTVDGKGMPGPGHYGSKDLFGKEGSKASVKFRPSTAVNQRTIESPGPGAYNPNFGAVKNVTPGSKIGSSVRDSFRQGSN